MPRPDKRQHVMQATLEIIADHGFHNAPTSLIAERAQVGMGTIYRYFKSKDELIHAIYEERLKEAKDYVLNGYDRTQSLRDRYLFLSRNLFKYLVEHPLDYKFFEQYRNSPYGPEAQLESILTFEKNEQSNDYPFMTVFKEGQQQGLIKQLQLSILSALTLSPILTLVGSKIAGTLQAGDYELELAFAASWDAIAKT